MIGTVPSELKGFARELAEHTDWHRIREDIEVKICRSADGEETFLLCRSASRIEKEKAMHNRFSQRIAKAKRALDRAELERQIGRLLGRNSRAAHRYATSITKDKTTPARLKLTWCVRSEWDAWAALSEGAYILRTNIPDWSDEELWKTYVQLNEAEAAFRIHKSDLCVRPIWHHKERRIKAHILVCFLAYALWKTLQQWQSRAGLADAPRTILSELARIHAADIVLPLADASRKELWLRCVVRPEREQLILLEHLGLTLPQRLRPPQMTPM